MKLRQHIFFSTDELKNSKYCFHVLIIAIMCVLRGNANSSEITKDWPKTLLYYWSWY